MLSNPNFPETQNFVEVLSTLCYLSHLAAYLDLFHRELNKMSVLKVRILNTLYKDDLL